MAPPKSDADGKTPSVLAVDVDVMDGEAHSGGLLNPFIFSRNWLPYLLCLKALALFRFGEILGMYLNWSIGVLRKYVNGLLEYNSGIWHPSKC